MFWLSTLNFWFAVGGLVLLVLTALLYIDYFFCDRKYYTKYLARFVWQLVLLTTVGGVALSLLYSEYFGFIPCSLCWLQRIALYPQALMGLMAFRAKEHIYFPLYGIGLSIFGFMVAVYHYIYQMMPKEESVTGMIMPCLADGSGDCATKVIEEFGFVTFPFLCAVMFAFLIVLYLNMRRS